MNDDLVETLRRPEYTGENRCLPCTAVNAAIAVVLGAVLSRRSKPAAAVALAGSAALIYLRGYLVPGTPALTKRYLPPSVLRLFGKSPEVDAAVGLEGIDSAGARSDVDVGPESDKDAEQADVDDSTEEDTETPPTLPGDFEAYFRDAGLVEPCENRDDLCLTDAFETAWLEAIDALDGPDLDLEAAAIDAFGFDADPDDVAVTEVGDGAYALRYGTRYAGKWPSYPAIVADLAAAGLLDEWLDSWPDYAPRQKGKLLNSLRMFLETCPTADGAVHIEEEVVESCCSSGTVIAAVCEETGDRIFEYQVADGAIEAGD
jgi:hypothetical protein